MRYPGCTGLVLGLSVVTSCGPEPVVPGGPVVGPPSAATPTARPVPLNHPPTVSIHAAQPEQGIWRVTEIAFAATAADPDGDVLDYIWDYGDGTVERSGAGTTHAFDTAGDVEVTLTVGDGHGGTATARRTVHIVKMSGRWLGLFTNGPQGGLRINGDVVQGTGPGFQGTMNTQNGNGLGGVNEVTVGGRFISPRDMRFTVPLCGELSYNGSWNESFTAFEGTGPGCGASFKHLELFR
jgi:hypothetical protein